MSLWVADAGPLIFLAKLERLDLLAGEDIRVPAGLAAIGTVGILLAARFQGKIPSLREEIDRLQTYGFRISKALMEEVLKVAGELDT
jgi:predicted nucleic acid-binding protein